MHINTFLPLNITMTVDSWHINSRYRKEQYQYKKAIYYSMNSGYIRHSGCKLILYVEI